MDRRRGAAMRKPALEIDATRTAAAAAAEIKAGEEEVEEPVSPTGRLFREPHFSCYIVSVLGLGGAVDLSAMRAGLQATLARHLRFCSLQVRCRLGQTETITDLTEISSLLRRHPNLDFLEEPFTPKEIDDVVADFPHNKSPGPDGFNAEFLHKCWPIVKKDFYDLCNQFHQDYPIVKYADDTLVIMPADISQLTTHLSQDKDSWLVTVNGTGYKHVMLGESGSETIKVRSTLLVNLRKTPGLHALANMMESGKNNGAQWGNRLGYMILPFHIANHEDPLEYVRKATQVSRRKKSSMESVFTFWSGSVILKILGIKAAASLCYGMMRNTTLSFSNVAGPTEQVVFYGHPIVYIAPGSYGHPHALTMHYQSYANIIKLVLSVDEAQFPDAHDLLDDFDQSLRLIKEAASQKQKDVWTNVSE
ncbi:wax ester synthase/diacylglycerol acyltransferase 6-like [Lolium perenne]|uniref:wax ester synthase/diacylglycerol acyltransferase 6-like n=1 Tax=Lolium perenne TaxID=4522 RepID=UPI0021F52025|nr:wax ester synthase/diacylglycerol acyltransferase 6-like [Lolium perenne]